MNDAQAAHAASDSWSLSTLPDADCLNAKVCLALAASASGAIGGSEVIGTQDGGAKWVAALPLKQVALSAR